MWLHFEYDAHLFREFYAMKTLEYVRIVEHHNYTENIGKCHSINNNVCRFLESRHSHHGYAK